MRLRARARRRRRATTSVLFAAPLLSLWIVGALCVKDVPVIHVLALQGKPTYLPCDITPSQEDDAVQLILWFREDRERSAAIYSVDARDRDINFAERWSDDKVFSSRAKFIHSRQPAELGVDHIREEDAGIYRCRVEFRVGQTRNSKVNLTVIVPPHKIAILNEKGIALGTSAGPYLEGDELRLFCDVHGGKPPPRVSWYRDGAFVGNASRTQREGLIRSELLLKNLERSDVDARLSCNATNSQRALSVSASVRINMHFNPLTVKILGSNQPLSAGRKYNLVCTTSGSRPPAHITWWKDESELKTKNTTSGEAGNASNTTSSVLSFTPSKADAGKRLFCRAENPIMRSAAIEDVWSLEIQYVPETQIRLGTNLDPKAIKEGSDVYFDCLIDAKPAVYKVEWRHQGEPLNHNVSRGVIISNQSLVLQGVERRSAGNYTCVGFNTEGHGESPGFHLDVMFAPTCRPNQAKFHGVAKKERASISCQVDANPPDVDFRWTFNNSAESIELSASHVSRAGTSSTASYTPTIEMDYGTLLCWASNQIGSQQVPCVYHIIPAGRPDVVHNCTTANTSKHSFTIRCSQGFDGGLTQAFLLEVRDAGSQQLRANLTSSSPNFSVSNLDAGSLYQAYVFAYNDKGRSDPMLLQAGTLSPPEKQLTSDSERSRPNMKLTPMLSVMIGVVAALVIVAVIVMIVLRIQHSQVDDQSKSQNEGIGKPAKAAPPIQRELRFRECGSLITDEKDPDAQVFVKLDTISAGDVSESDEKNPDIIPQQITDLQGCEMTCFTGEEVSEYLRKRRLVSTIETSPSRGLLDRSAVAAAAAAAAAAAVGSRGNYVGYCTIRRDLPLRDLSHAVKFKHKNLQPAASEVYESGMCTLPRQHSTTQHWPSHAPAPMSVSPTVMYNAGPAGAPCNVSLLRARPGIIHQAAAAAAHPVTPPAAAAAAAAAPLANQCCGALQPKDMGKVTASQKQPAAALLLTKRESSV